MFTAKERRIFRFHNGERVVARDPRQVFLKLQATMPANYDILAQQLDESDKAIDETLPEHEKRELATKNAAAVLNAEETLGKWIANAFNVKVMDDDGNGMTYDELVALDIEFHEFLEKKSETPSQTTNSAEVSPASGPPVTLNGSDCGCGEKKPATAASTT
jgi:hypothetical protein